MYCLDCGTKIDDGELQCPHCGSLVNDMKARIAAAEEIIVYTDAVSPSRTSKLPLVSERSYQDYLGNPLDPSNEVGPSKVTKSAKDLKAIPTIGDEDPFITKPMQRIVTDTGQVVADVDREPKAYRQAQKRRRFPIGQVVICVLVVAILACGLVFGSEIQSAIQAFVSPEVKTDAPFSQSDQAVASSAEQPYSEGDFSSDLSYAYANLASLRSEADEAVDDLEGYYRVSSSETRGSYADKCVSLIDEITQERSELSSSREKAQISADSELYDKYQKVDELYGYLLDRLSVISQCWEVSLTFDDPKKHDSEILAPLKTDLKGGNSVSEAAFDKLYPEADPSK